MYTLEARLSQLSVQAGTSFSPAKQQDGFSAFWVKPKRKQILGFKLCHFWVLLGLWKGNSNNVIAMKVMKTHKHQFQKCQCRTPEDVMCVGITEHTVVWGSGPFLSYQTGCWTESWVLRMSAQEIILPECYKGQGNAIFHFSFLHAEWWIKNLIFYISYKKIKNLCWARSKNGTASVACCEARAPFITWWASATYLLW